MSRISPGRLAWLAVAAGVVAGSVGATLLVLTPSAARPQGYLALIATLASRGPLATPREVLARSVSDA